MSAELSALDEILADIAESDPLALTPEQLRTKLSTGLLWWQAVSAAVSEAPERLASWARGTEERLASAIDDPELLESSRTIAAVGLVLAAARGERPKSEGIAAIAAAARRWRQAGLLPEDVEGTHDWPPLTELRLVDSLSEGADRSLAHIAVGLMSGAVKLPAYRHEVRILFDTGERKGATGSLRLAVLPGGPPGLYPDPRSMTFLRVDEEFTASLNSAWRYATRHRRRPPCVLWTIDPGQRRLGPITGPSLGAAFAVALVTAVRRVTVFDALWQWREKCAVTGAVSPSGSVGAVFGLEGKFEAARTAGWNVVAPHGNRDLDGTPLVAGIDVHWVSSVRQARRKTRGWRPNRLITSMIAAALVAAVGVVVWQTTSFRERENEALRRTAVSEVLRQAASTRGDNQTKALQLVLAAHGLGESDQVKAAAVAALTVRREPVTLFSGRGVVRTTEFTSEGRALIAGDMGASLWSVANPSAVAELRPLGSGGATAATVNGRLVVVQRGATVEVWDLTAPQNADPLTFSTGCDVVSVSVDGARRRLLTACADGTATVWDLTTPGPLKALSELDVRPDKITAVAFGGLDEAVVVATSHAIRLWKAESSTGSMSELPGSGTGFDPGGRVLDLEVTGAVVGDENARAEFLAPEQQGKPEQRWSSAGLNFANQKMVTAAAHTSDRRLVLTGDESGDAVLWQGGANGDYRPRMLLHGHTDAVTSIGLSGDGQQALTGSRDGSVKLWDLHTTGPFELGGITAPDNEVRQVVTSPKNATGVVISENGAATLWDFSDYLLPKRQTKVRFHTAPVRSAAMDPVRTTQLATGSADGVVILSDIANPADPKTPRSLKVGDEAVDALAFQPGGTLVAAGSADGSVVLADVGTLAPSPLPRKGQSAVGAVAFSPGGNLLAVGDVNGSVELWQLGAGTPVLVGEVPKLPNSGVLSLAFDPRGGKLLVVGDASNSVWQWDVAEPSHPDERPSLQVRAGKVRAVEYSQDGTMVVGASTDGTAVLWSLLDPGTPYRMAELTGHTGPVLGVGIVAGGDIVVTGSADKTMIAWDISELVTINRNPKERACREAGGTLAEEDWRRHEWLRHFPYRDVCR